MGFEAILIDAYKPTREIVVVVVNIIKINMYV